MSENFIDLIFDSLIKNKIELRENYNDLNSKIEKIIIYLLAVLNLSVLLFFNENVFILFKLYILLFIFNNFFILFYTIKELYVYTDKKTTYPDANFDIIKWIKDNNPTDKNLKEYKLDFIEQSKINNEELNNKNNELSDGVELVLNYCLFSFTLIKLGELYEKCIKDK
ncbi:MAG: hypothetical protein Ta2D_13290 [Rickettsiales bacterium]|nr:MAG: hypothetical protein Ta2D_13290 [Rickettsiales bacterium]